MGGGMHYLRPKHFQAKTFPGFPPSGDVLWGGSFYPLPCVGLPDHLVNA